MCLYRKHPLCLMYNHFFSYLLMFSRNYNHLFFQNLLLRGKGTAAVGGGGNGIAATGSYVRFNSLRDAPPEGEAFSP